MALFAIDLSAVEAPAGAATTAATDAPLDSAKPVDAPLTQDGGDFSSPPPTASELAAMYSSPLDNPPANSSTIPGKHQPPSLLAAAAPLPASVPRNGCGTAMPKDVTATTGGASKRDAALLRACAKGKDGFDAKTSRKLDELTSPTQEVFQNADGSRTARVSPSPVRFKDAAGVWKPIDLALVTGKDGLTTKSSELPVTVPSDPTKGLAVISTPSGEIRLSAPGLAKSLASPAVPEKVAAQVAPRAAQVAEAKPIATPGDVTGVTGVSGSTAGPSVRVTPRADGFEQDTILADASAGSSYLVDLSLPAGATARASGYGVDLVGADGVVFAQFGGGVASDAKINPNSGLGTETSVTTKLVSVEGSVAHVEVSIDEKWLADPARVFPVTIDPLLTYTLSSSTWGTKDTFTESGWTTPQYASTELRVGTYADEFGDPAGGDDTLLYFPLNAIQGDDVTVTEAHLTMYDFWSSTCDPSAPLITYGIGQAWDQTTVVDSNAPLGDGLGIRTTVNFAKGNSGACPADWVSLDATSLAKQWAQTFLGVANNSGMYISPLDYNNVQTWRRFYSGESGFWSAPYLQVTYSHTPSVPALSAPVNESTVASTTPTLSWAPSTDADGDPISYTVRVATGSDAETGTIVWDSGALNPANGVPAPSSVTVPAGRLRDGETYYWHVWAGDPYGWTRPLTAQKFTVNARLGTGQPSPYDSFGPASVNLATGNLVVQTASPQYATVGGGIGLNYSYNSQEPTRAGLTGSYYAGMNVNGNYVQREVDQTINFDWGTGSPVSGGLWPDQWSARWTGYITVPYSGTWTFGTINDDGARVWVDDMTTPKVDFWTDGGHLGWGSPVTLQAGQPYPIKVEFYDNTGAASMRLVANHANFASAPVPADWFTTDAPGLPTGWQLGLGGTVNYQHITPGWGFVLVEGTDGSKHMFIGTTGGWVPVIGEEGMLARDTNGVWWFLPGDGLFYMFDGASGNLSKVYQANDLTQTAATEFTWAAGSPPRVASISDPVSGRSMTVAYGGDSACPTPPSGFSAAPLKQLCKVTYWDAASSSYFYDSYGNLARLVDPGGETTDFAYDAGRRLTTIRDPLAYDAVFASSSPRLNNATTLTTISYDTSVTPARVSSVQLPAPLAGETQPKHTYTYTINPDGAGSATVGSLGVSNASRVAFDSRKRVTSSIDTANVKSTTTWSPVKDIATRVDTAVDTPAQMVTSTVYDYADRPTDSYGPAPLSMFDANGAPTTDVPHSQTRYDEGMNSLSVSYYNNTQLAGPPVAHSLGIGDPSGALNHAWNGASPANGVNGQNWSARLTGDLTLPTYGWYTMSIWAGDGVRMWIDDKLVIDSWAGGPGLRTGAYANADYTKPHRVRIEYFQGANNNSNLSLWQTDPYNASSLVAGSQLVPRYGLVTSATDPDNKTTASTFTEPWAALTANTRVDPAGLNLTTSYTYEGADATHFRRQLTKTLPAGNTWTYAYYGNTATSSSTCAGTNVNQGGALKTRTGPAPAGGGSRVEEFAYDQAGKPLGSRIGSDPWTCMTYDARERVLTKSIPAFGGEPARTVTYNYSVGGNPLVGSVSDTAGTITTTVDLLGRARSSTDVWGKTISTTYDVAGRVTTAVGPRPTDTVTNTYDAAIGRLTSIAVDGATTANVFYDTVGRVDHYEYPNGTGNNGDGTKLAPVVRDSLQRTVGLTWQTMAGTTITSDLVTRSTAGDVKDESIDGVDAAAGDNFTYDSAGRLTTAKVAGHTYNYGFGTPSGCGAGSVANAGANTNRTSVTDIPTGGSATTTYSCYDAADKLTSTPVYASVAYDAHGNTTSLGAETLGYDGADRHMVSTSGTTQVRYTRDATDAIVGRTVATVTPPSSGIAFRAQTSNNNGTSGTTSLQLTRPAGVQTGDALLAVLTVDATPTITPPSGWSQVATASAGAKSTTVAFVHVAAVGDPANWTWSFSAASRSIGAVIAYGGTSPASPVDVSATSTQTTATTSHVAASVTTSLANEQLVTAYGINAAATVTPAAGMTERVDAPSGGSADKQVTLEVSDATVPASGATGTRTAVSSTSGKSANLTIALRPDPGSTTITQTDRYTAGATLDANNNIIERTFGLPGGVSVTKRTASQVWSYPNLHGDVAATTDQNGAKQGATFAYDPYGNSLNSQIPDNKDGNFDTGWIGARTTEHETGLAPIIEMGARQYDPRLGRFLEVDPVPGGSCNHYDYVCGNPINVRDVDGDCPFCFVVVVLLVAALAASSVATLVYVYKSVHSHAAALIEKTQAKRFSRNARNQVRGNCTAKGDLDASYNGVARDLLKSGKINRREWNDLRKLERALYGKGGAVTQDMTPANQSSPDDPPVQQPPWTPPDPPYWTPVD